MEFTKAYERLNPEQKRAVDTIEGPVMVIAGPGTGKTQILTLRIANILEKTDTDPGAILALTYTEAGVTAMRERLASFIGATAYAVKIHTYHSFAERLVREHGEYLERLRDGFLVDDVEQREVLERAFDSVSVPSLRTKAQPYRAMREVVSFIRDAKRELWTPEKLIAEYEKGEARIKSQSDFTHEKGKYAGQIKGEYAKALNKIAKNKEAVLVYEAYEKILGTEGKYDFEDLLLEVVHAFETNEEFKRVVQEEYLYFLADEHQDANATQNEILLHLADFHEEPNIFVVGDEKQAIYRFQGADLDTFLTLKERYASAEIILLETNYRSTQEVLDTAHGLIQKAPIPDTSIRKELTAHRGVGPKVLVCKAPTFEDELSSMAGKIAEWKKSGAEYENIAVLVRKNIDAFTVSSALTRAEIPHTIAARENVLEMPFAKLFLALLRGIWDQDVEGLAQGLFLPGAFEDLRERLEFISSLRKGVPQGEMGDKLLTLQEHVRQYPAARAVPHIVEELGIIRGIAGRSDAQELYGVLEALLSDIEKFAMSKPGADVGAYLERIERIKAHELLVVSRRKQAKGVQVLTAHGSKGLEFPYVYIPFVTDARYGKTRVGEVSIPAPVEQSEHDERRLLYVAITRAEKEAVLSYAEVNTTGKAETPSRFIYDIEEFVEDMAPVEYTLPLIGKTEEQALIDPDFIKQRVVASGLSATAYGNYKADPWKYFFRNVLRLPEGKSVSLIYGSAVHAALEEAGRQAFSGKEIDVEAVLSVFEKYMEQSDLTQKEKDEFIPEGKDEIRAYIEHAVFGEKGEVEYEVSVPLSVPGVGDVVIRGKLDRIDIREDGVRVIDYKTGKPKSENEIRGLTAKGDPSYFVQIMFYALLLKYNPRHEFSMKEGVLEFVQQNDSGKYVSRSFSIDPGEVEKFEEELKKDLADIVNGTFLSVPPTEEYEALASFILEKQESDR